MSEEGDIPNVTEMDKSTGPTLRERLGSLTGTNKSKEIEALKKEVSQLTKEAEEKQGQIDQYTINQAVSKKLISHLEDDISRLTTKAEERQREIDQYTKYEVELKSRISQLEDENKLKSAKIENLNLEMSENVRKFLEKMDTASTDQRSLYDKVFQLTKELEERAAEFERYKMESLDNKKNLEFEVQLKSTEIENLKESEAELKSQISQLEDENKSKSVKIENINLEMSQNVQTFLEKVDKTSIDLRSLHNKTPFMILRAKFTGISKLTSTFVYSQWTELAGLKWRICLYQYHDYLHGIVESDSDCTASVVLQLISQKNENIVHSQNETKSGSVWAFLDFISFKDLFDEEKGYVKDDSIIFASTIKVFPNTDIK